MKSNLVLRITGFCIYNGVMVYLKAHKPNYTMTDLKEDLTITFHSWYNGIPFPSSQTFIWISPETHINLTEEQIGNSLGSKYFKSFDSWKVEKDEQIHPIVSYERSNSETSHSNDQRGNIV